MTKVLTIKY